MTLTTDRKECELVYAGFIRVFQCSILFTIYTRLSGYVYKITTGTLSKSVYIRYLLVNIYFRLVPTGELILIISTGYPT